MITVKELYKKYSLDGQHVHLKGWVRNNRAQKEFGLLTSTMDRF